MRKMSNKTEKISEKPQTTEKALPNQSLSTHSFLKSIDNKKKDTQGQKVDNQPLDSAAIQANPTKTPITIPKESIVNLDLKLEMELEKTKETKRKKETEENETEKNEREVKEKLFR